MSTAAPTFAEQCTTAVRRILSWTATPTFSGDAYQWAAAGQKAGYNVTGPGTGRVGAPAAGDVAVWGQGVAGADPKYGHVADVTGVNADGSLNIIQANWPEKSPAHADTVSAGMAQKLDYIAPPGGTPPPGSAQLTDAILPNGTRIPLPGPDFNVPNIPGAVAAIPGAVASATVGAVWNAFSGIADATVIPWFERHLVPIVAGLAITLVVTSDHKGPAAVTNVTSAPPGPPAGTGAGASDSFRGVPSDRGLPAGKSAPAAPAEEPWLASARAKGMVTDLPALA